MNIKKYIITGAISLIIFGASVYVCSAVDNTTTDSVTVSISTPQLDYFWDNSAPTNKPFESPDSGWQKALDPGYVNINYNIGIKNLDTGGTVSCGSTVSFGTHVRLSFPTQTSTDVSFFGTGYSSDSPYGSWIAGTPPPMVDGNVACLDNDFAGNSTQCEGPWGVFIALVINPPTMTITDADGNSCADGSACGITCGSLTGDEASGYSMDCTLTNPVNLNSLLFNFSSTNGVFYYRYSGASYTPGSGGFSGGPTGSNDTGSNDNGGGGGSAGTAGNNYMGCWGNNAPLQTAECDENIGWCVGLQNHCGHDYILDIPAQSINCPITVVANGDCGSGNGFANGKTYPPDATGFGDDALCAAGSASPSPAFPTISDPTTTWTCLGSAGGTDSSTCSATIGVYGCNDQQQCVYGGQIGGCDIAHGDSDCTGQPTCGYDNSNQQICEVGAGTVNCTTVADCPLVYHCDNQQCVEGTGDVTCDITNGNNGCIGQATCGQDTYGQPVCEVGAGSVACTTVGDCSQVYSCNSQDQCVQSCVSSPLNYGLVAYYSLDGNAGGAANSGVTFSTGQVGQAGNFDGSSYIETPSSLDLDIAGDQLTMSTWMYATSGDRVIMGNDIYAHSLGSWGLAYFNSSPQCLINISGGQWDYSFTSSFGLDEWHYITCTYDGSNVTLYVDGALDSTFPQTGNITQVDTPMLTIGDTYDHGGYAFAGMLDETAVWNRGLSAGEVATLWNYGAGTSLVENCSTGGTSCNPGNGNGDCLFDYTCNDQLQCVKNGGGASCNPANAGSDCLSPYGCDMYQQCVRGGSQGSCNIDNGNGDCTPKCAYDSSGKATSCAIGNGGTATCGSIYDCPPLVPYLYGFNGSGGYCGTPGAGFLYFGWSYSDVSNETRSELQISNSSDFGSATGSILVDDFMSGNSDSNVLVSDSSAINFGNTYYWRVRVCNQSYCNDSNGQGYGDWATKDDQGNTLTFTTPAHAYPNADFSFLPLSPLAKTNVVFTNSSTCPDTCGYSWTFGDGNTSTVSDPSHSYSTTGPKSVSLTVCDAENYCCTATKPLSVKSPLGVPNYKEVSPF